MSIKKTSKNLLKQVFALAGLKIGKIDPSICGYEMRDVLGRISRHQFNINTIIDIGASDGKWSVEALEMFPHSEVLAVEALEERKNSLETLRKANPRFNYEMCVAGNVSGGSVMLSVASDLDGSTVNGNGGNGRLVSQKTLDSIAKERKLQGPFLIKFDTHGYEIPILEGATKMLAETSIIIMETYNFKITENSLRFHEMCGYMEKIGFRVLDVAGPLNRELDQAFWQIDLVFAKSDSKAFTSNSYR